MSRFRKPVIASSIAVFLERRTITLRRRPAITGFVTRARRR
jgi:hypothetical protein